MEVPIMIVDHHQSYWLRTAQGGFKTEQVDIQLNLVGGEETVVDFSESEYIYSEETAEYLDKQAGKARIILLGNNLGLGLKYAAAVRPEFRNRIIVLSNQPLKEAELESYRQLGVMRFFLREEVTKAIKSVAQA